MLVWTLKPGRYGNCEACAPGKAKDKYVAKESVHAIATKNNERIYLDIATTVKEHREL